MPTLIQLEYVIAVEQEGHFGKAAQRCHVSQPSLSNSIKKLERELGVILFDRAHSPIRPTEAGLKFIEQSRRVLLEAKRLTHLADSSRGVPTGRFHLGVIPTLAPYMVPFFAGELAKKYEHGHLVVSEMKTDVILRLLEEDEIDAGLLVTPLHHPKIVETPLFLEPFHAFVSDAHPLARKKVINEEELEPENLWLLEEGHCFRDQALNICNSRSHASKIENLELTSGNLSTLIKLIERYSGFTLLPEMATYDLTNEQKRNLRSFEPPIPTREVSLVHGTHLIKKTIFSVLKKQILESIPKSLKIHGQSQARVIPL